ncbi:MAG: hypothetical protein KDC85_18190 [Saprospiraceae bacterium]|nr:hypothetical protein [Saprospiraceae bacterium]MCB9325865.1 hypothetical protein [Lewinellaceae bacterium]
METVATTNAKCIHTGIPLRYAPTKITKKAKQILREYVEEFGVVGRSLGITLEYAYRKFKDQSFPPHNQTIMTAECQKWSQSEHRDPQLPFSRYSSGHFMGINHSWGSVFTYGPADYTKADPLEIIDTIPTH